jgi:hypothetical protein
VVACAAPGCFSFRLRAVSLQKIHLRKCLQLLYSPDRSRKSLLRRSIRAELAKDNAAISNGGDFHAPFWTDAKRHVAGLEDLDSQSNVRIQSNNGRARLYPELTKRFLEWWNEKRRWRNEPFRFLPGSVKSQLQVPELGIFIKVENTLALAIGDHSNRIIYPYFSEHPALSEEAVRIGLWLLSEALPEYDSDDLRILDVLRSASHGKSDVPFKGDERDLFLRNYAQVLAEWSALREEYR